ncbi:hypothetical protein ACU61A_09125 [Pseudonocardia sichuanensis]
MTMIGDALQELLGLPGARYSCVADPVTGEVLGESGGVAGPVPAGFLTWGSGAARFLAETDGDDLEDLVVSSRRSYHLVRQVGAGGTGRLLVYLRLDRERGNLAAARRELASPRLRERLTGGGRTGARAALPPGQPLSPAATASPAGVRPVPLAALPGAPLPWAAAPATGPTPSPWPRGSSRSVSERALGAHPGTAVPQQRRSATGLPRRAEAPPSRLPPPASAEAAPAVPDELPESGLTWANDAGTLRRLLAALRRMA